MRKILLTVMVLLVIVAVVPLYFYLSQKSLVTDNIEKTDNREQMPSDNFPFNTNDNLDQAMEDIGTLDAN